MTTRIKSLKVNAFRGLPHLELNPDGKSLVIRGENGTGKSSLVEAIEFFFTGKVTHLEGVQGVSLAKHGPHVHFGKEDVRVSLTFDPGDISLTRDFAHSPTPPTQLANYFDVTQKGAFILRRAQILEFIISQPAERFRAIGSIIGIDSLDTLELELMRARDQLEGEMRSRRADISSSYSRLSSLLETEIRGTKEVLNPLNKYLKKNGFREVSSLTEIDGITRGILKSARAKDFAAKSSLQVILKDASKFHITQDTVNFVRELEVRISKLMENVDSGKLEFLKLLQIGGEIITDKELDTCPLCEQPIDRNGVLGRINQRIATMTALSNEASEIRKNSVQLAKTLDKIKDNCESASERIKEFSEMAAEVGKLKEMMGLVEEYKGTVENSKELKSGIHSETFEKLASEVNGVMSAISSKSNKKSEDFNLSNDEQRIFGAFRSVEQVREIVNEIHKSEPEAQKAEKQYNIGEEIYNSFRNSKNNKVQDVYDAIQLDVRDFYLMLHPGESTMNVELQVVTGRRASAGIKVDSFGDMVDPRAFTSEGHLDSLGLCIFLAFTTEFNKGCSLVVLDDVVTTIDAEHREKICKLLLENFRESQLVITTHDEIWYEQLRANQRAYGLDGTFQNLVIKKWDVDSGPSIQQYKPRWDRISELISSGEKGLAGNEGRKYLEYTVEKICEITNAKVPYNKRGRYEVGDLFPSAKTRMMKLLKEGDLKSKISAAFVQVESTAIVSNIMSHNNSLSRTVSVDEVRSFCVGVNALHNLFLCPSCQHYLIYDQTIRIIQCSNARCSSPFREETN